MLTASHCRCLSIDMHWKSSSLFGFLQVGKTNSCAHLRLASSRSIGQA
jgi:hypothetical protein